MKKIRLLALAGLLVFWAARDGAATLSETFTHNPFQEDWRVFGDTNLFHWNTTNQDLDVTWDSSQPNSYFYHSLGTILTRQDAFSLAFDLELYAVHATGSFQVTVGLLNFADATNANFSRPLADTPNVFEFDYFPDTGFGPSLDATLADATVSATNTSDFYFAYENLPLAENTLYHVVLTHGAGEPGLSGVVYTNGQVYASLTNVYAGPISDFRLDTLSINSFSAAGDTYGDSMLAHGAVDNLTVTLPPPPVQNLTGFSSNGVWQAQFTARSNWLYTLQRTTNLQSWLNVSPATPGRAGSIQLSDTNAPTGEAFYRIRAELP